MNLNRTLKRIRYDTNLYIIGINVVFYITNGCPGYNNQYISAVDIVIIKVITKMKNRYS